MKILHICFSIALFFTLSVAQQSQPDTLTAFRINEEFVSDGIPSEIFWQTAHRIQNFTQRELSYGQPASEKTEVAVVYNSTNLYIAVWCHQIDTNTIVVKSLQRDFNYDAEDNFKTLISPFNDKRTGYLFIINPLGARADLLVTSGEESNMDWNGVWDAKTNKTDYGWTAEIVMPYTTLKFKNTTAQVWAINFERNIKSKNEQSCWQGWSRDFSIENIAVAGTLTDLNDIIYKQRFELKPYMLGGWTLKDDKITYKPTGKIGADLNYQVSPTLKLNLTTNTDFAQVEADRIQTNLTRFNLYYPEKREFFLEGSNQYKLYLGNGNELFYSRNIGIENLHSVDVLGGVRLFGKETDNNIGFLSMQTVAVDSIPTTNNTVFRYTRDVGVQSHIGGIVTSKYNTNHQNVVVGIDGNYTTSKFMEDKNIVIAGLLSTSLDEGKRKNQSLSYHFFIDYPNDLFDIYWGTTSIQRNFNPELGFLQRTNFTYYEFNFRYSPRWFEEHGIRKLYLKPFEAIAYFTNGTGELESFYNESRPFGFGLKNGDEFEFNLQQKYDRLDIPFTIADSISIVIGKYWMYKYELQYNTFKGRNVWAELYYNWGDYYAGKIQTASSAIGININEHFNIKNEYSFTQIKIQRRTVEINQLATYFNYAFTTRLDIAFFSQWNTEEDLYLVNFRLHWIPKIGTDLFAVWNNGYEQLKHAEFAKPTINDGAVKLVWRFLF